MASLRQTKQILLASQSPQRIQLLKQAGLNFFSMTSNYEEPFKPLPPAELAQMHALGKVIDVAARYEEPDNVVIVGVDTLVVCQDRILEKPKNADEAREILDFQQKAGESVVISGIAILEPETGREIVDHVKTTVKLNKLTDAEIDWYVQTKEWQEKSGGFAIHGLASRFFAGIEGDFNSVIGLPTAYLYQVLLKWGIVSK